MEVSLIVIISIFQVSGDGFQRCTVRHDAANEQNDRLEYDRINHIVY